VTEYHFHESNDFVIHVDYFTLDELKKQFEELLNAYREHRSPQSNSRDNTGRDENNTDRTRSQEKANLAEETFKASFGERLRQDDPILSTVPFERAVETMVEWASQLLPQEIGQESFSTMEECSSRLRALVSESDSPLADGQSRARWPFIRKMRVYLRAYILSKGLIIADLPGLRDLNSARKAITESYVRQCHQIFVVAKIDRAISNESIKEIIELASRVNLSKIDVVCTRSEDIETSEARHDWMAESATIDELQTQINADKEAIESLQEEIEEYLEDDVGLTREEERELVKLQKDKLRAEKSKEENDFKLLRLIIKLRNDKVRDGLQESYRSHPIATTLKVFCTSKNLYEENRDKPVATALPFLNLSGILELRRYCIGIVADSRLHATRDFINNAIPAFLGSVELWIQAGSGSASAEKKQQILDAMAAIEQELDEVRSKWSPRIDT
jgi:GTPase SAR1 family protein